jgi:hypothetical protein
MTKEKIEQNLVLKPSINFSLSIIDFCEGLDANKKYLLGFFMF